LCSQNLASGGVEQETPHPPKEQKTRVRIPPGYMFFIENAALQFFILGMIHTYVHMETKLNRALVRQGFLRSGATRLFVKKFCQKSAQNRASRIKNFYLTELLIEI
jgi:hypothetical protein